MSSSDLAQFAGRNYLSLESFRKNGQGVKTPVWFAEENGVFYFYTEADSFKVKRIRNNPAVRIAPCDVRGNLQGTWVDATAELLEGDAARHTHDLIRRKYRLQKWIADVFSKFRNNKRAEIAIRPRP